MQILIITPFIPYPLTEGGKASQFATIDYLRRLINIKMVLIARNKEDRLNINHLISIWPEVDIQIIDAEILHTRTIDIAKFAVKKLRSYLAKKIFKHKSTYTKVGINSSDTFNITTGKDKKFIDRLELIISGGNYDIIQIEFLDFADLIFALPKNAKRVFVHHEIYFAKLESESNRAGHSSSNYDAYAIEYTKNRETGFLKLYDAIFTFSKADKCKLEMELPNHKIFNTPFPVLDSFFRAFDSSEYNVNKLIFLGPEIHYPNREGVEWYIDSLQESILLKTGLKLHVIGNWGSTFKDRYKSNVNIIFEGYVEDLVTFCKNSVMVVPVRIGSGIRTKILYAMAQSVPVVSTSLGCEGIDVEHEKDIMIADTSEDFANAVLKLATDSSFAASIAKNAYALVEQTYSQKAVADLRSACYQQIISSK